MEKKESKDAGLHINSAAVLPVKLTLNNILFFEV